MYKKVVLKLLKIGMKTLLRIFSLTVMLFIFWLLLSGHYNPLFYAYGYKEDIMNFREYKKIFKKIPSFHKASYLRAQKIIKKNDKGGKFIFHHPAYL